MRPGRSIYAILWAFALLWIFCCAWSFWMAESSPLEATYFAARDAIQPGGYAVGRLHRAPSWALFHIVLGFAPPAVLFGVRTVTSRR